VDRLKGLSSFTVVAAVVLMGLRLLHLAVPIAFPGTQPGPIAVANLDEAGQRAGYSPIVPGYHPAALGADPTSITILFRPTPTLIMVWRQDEHYLSITERRGGQRPAAPPTAEPLAGVADSLWWASGTERHLIVARVGYWIELTTNLPVSDLKRFADTLTVY
jgi:hypothetical protein